MPALFVNPGMDFTITLTSPGSGEVIDKAKIPVSAGDNYTRLVETLYRMSGGDIGAITLGCGAHEVTIPLYCPTNQLFMGRSEVTSLAKLIYGISASEDGKIALSLPSGETADVTVTSDARSDADLADATRDEALGETWGGTDASPSLLRRTFGFDS